MISDRDKLISRWRLINQTNWIIYHNLFIIREFSWNIKKHKEIQQGGWMFNLGKKLSSQASMACFLAEQSYSLSALKNNKEVIFSLTREFSQEEPSLFSTTLAKDVKNLNAIGASCRLILSHQLYQLILMDTLDIPEHEKRKAFRWRLDGLVDYPLNDVAVDAFLLPSQGVNKNKAYVAATRLSSLTASLEIFKAAYLKISQVTLSELALKNLFALIFPTEACPIIVVNLNNKGYQILGIYQNQLCMVRELASVSLFQDNVLDTDTMILEIQRSMDYLISEVRIPQPKELVFTPGFPFTDELLTAFELGLEKNITLLDLNNYFEMPTHLDLSEQKNALYSICGAIAPSPLTEENIK